MERLTISLTKEQRDLIDAFCIEKDLHFSGFIRKIIIDHIKRELEKANSKESD